MKTCFDGFTYVGNALVKMYASGEGVREAWRVFECLKFRNIVTWNSMVAAFQSRGKWEDGLRLFTLMRREWEIGFDHATLLSVLSSLLMVKDNGSDVISLCLNYCSQLHCLAIKTRFISEIGVITALAKAYADLDAEMSDLYRLFIETFGMRDIVSWTAFIMIFAEHDPEESLLMFSKLFQEGFSPDRHTYSIVLKACADLVTDRHTLAIHSQILKYGFENDIVLANALIHAYGRSGSVLEYSKVFDLMLIKDIVSWNSMIKIYGLHGQPKEALKCFDEMNIHPDSTTFVALLSACSHTGMVKERTKLFETMSKTYGIAPQLDHYACMVDIFGRSGQTLETQKLINEMPIEPDSVIWSAMLGACRKYGDTKLAEFAAKKLQELDPNNSLDIRKQMKGLGVKKGPGLSWTEVGKWFHEFGYVAETNLAMRDIEEEDKNKELSYHSEKLAFVFALKHAESKSSRRAIRIVKNIRICVDCHNFMKFASDLTGREIIVRDSNSLCCDDWMSKHMRLGLFVIELIVQGSDTNKFADTADAGFIKIKES
ncbi:pentatricopeptide repeat-containing protein [Tanacetum coccineum]